MVLVTFFKNSLRSGTNSELVIYPVSTPCHFQYIDWICEFVCLKLLNNWNKVLKEKSNNLEKIDLYLFWQVACCNGLMDATTKRSHLACVALLNITFILKWPNLIKLHLLPWRDRRCPSDCTHLSADTFRHMQYIGIHERQCFFQWSPPQSRESFWGRLNSIENLLFVFSYIWQDLVYFTQQ